MQFLNLSLQSTTSAYSLNPTEWDSIITRK